MESKIEITDGYYLDVCKSGMFAGCAAVRKVGTKRPWRYKIVCDKDGNKYAPTKDEPEGCEFRRVTEEEAYDILCGDTDMSFAGWGTCW